MTEHERNQAPEPRQDATGQDHAAPRGMSRRRFGQAALGTVPVLMTLYSNPLRASNGTGGNCHPSGWVSGNTSRYGEAEDCGGESPGHWSNQGNGGGSAEAKNTDFNTVFGFSEGEFTDGTGESLNLSYATRKENNSPSNNNSVERNGRRVESDEREVIRYGSAAYMSRVESKYAYSRPTEEEIINMVKAVLDGEDYQIPGTGEKLNIDGVLAFLKNTESGEQGFKTDGGLLNI